MDLPSPIVATSAIFNMFYFHLKKNKNFKKNNFRGTQVNFSSFFYGIPDCVP